jgi:predicted DsbA family dithiol-disulfide isomerase
MPGHVEIVKLLEAARRQGKYAETLEVVLSSQPNWAVRHVARLDLALKAVERVGLDMVRLKVDIAAPDLARLIKQDMDDAAAFFVNRRPLVELGYEELRELVAQEVRRSYGPAAPR